MSVKGIHWAQDVHKVGPFRKVILLNLGERHNIDTGLCTVDQVMLARDCDMTDRTLRKYLKELENEKTYGLITRRVVNTGRGRQTHYTLHFERTLPLYLEGGPERRSGRGVRKDIPHGGPESSVPDPSGKQLPDPSGTLLPVHKEHEGYTKDTRTLSSDPNGSAKRKGRSKKAKAKPKVIDDKLLQQFDQIWRLWPRKGRERSRSRSDCLDQLQRAAKLQPVSAIVDAAAKFVGASDHQFCPGLDRWLKQGRYEHFLPKDLVDQAQDTAVPAKPEIDWPEMVARWWRSEIWPNRLGERPDEWGYSGPIEPVEALMGTVLATGRTHGDRLARLKRNIDDVKRRRLPAGKAKA